MRMNIDRGARWPRFTSRLAVLPCSGGGVWLDHSCTFYCVGIPTRMIRHSSRSSACSGGNGLNDLHITRAPANVAAQRVNNFVPRRGWIFVKQRAGRHEKTGRAKAALHGAIIDEGFLQGIKRPVLFKAFDGPESLRRPLAPPATGRTW